MLVEDYMKRRKPPRRKTMSKAADVVIAEVKKAVVTQIGLSAQDFERFVAPALADLDNVLAERNPRTRDQLLRSLDAQIKRAAPELQRVTAAASTAKLITTIANTGVGILVGLVSKGAVRLTEDIDDFVTREAPQVDSGDEDDSEGGGEV